MNAEKSLKEPILVAYRVLLLSHNRSIAARKVLVTSNVTMALHGNWWREIICNNLMINWRIRLTWFKCWRWWHGYLHTRLHVVVVCRHFLTLWAQDLFWNDEEKKETASEMHLRRLVFERGCRILKWYTFSPDAILIHVTLKPSE